MARLRERLPVSGSPVLNNDGTYTNQHRRFLLDVEKEVRKQLPSQDALDGGASLGDVITAFNTLVANLKTHGLMKD